MNENDSENKATVTDATPEHESHFAWTPDGLCPMCYRDGEEVQMEYVEEWELDECPECGYYE